MPEKTVDWLRRSSNSAMVGRLRASPVCAPDLLPAMPGSVSITNCSGARAQRADRITKILPNHVNVLLWRHEEQVSDRFQPNREFAPPAAPMPGPAHLLGKVARHLDSIFLAEGRWIGP